MLNGTTKAIDGIRPAGIPELDRIAADPRCLAGLSKPAITALLMRAAVVQSALTAALAIEDSREQPAPIALEDDRMLTIEEAAALMRKSPQYLYRNKDRFSSFMRKTGPRSYVCSEAGVRRWLAMRRV